MLCYVAPLGAGKPAAALTDVTASFSIARSEISKDASANTFRSLAMLKNVGSQPVNAPLRMVLSITPASMTLANQSGLMPDGKPYIDVVLLDGFALPQEQLTVKLIFSKKNPQATPGNVPLDFTARLLAASTAPPIVIKISEPPAGANLSSARAAVAGAVSAPFATGIDINGSPACILDERFFANDLPVSDNFTFTAVAHSPGGATGQDSVAVTAPPRPVGVRIIAQSPCGGVAPFAAVFDADLIGIDSANVQQLDVDFDGDGRIDLSSSDLAQPVSFTYTAPGMYRAQFTLREKNGALHEVSHFVSVQDAGQGQKVFREIFTRLRVALTARDIPHALSYLTISAAARYGPILKQLEAQLPAFVATWSDMQPVEIGDQFAQFAVTRPVAGVTRMFGLVFVKDAHGTWKIDSM